jgi:hypothetical protein
VRNRAADRYLFKIYFGSNGQQHSTPTGMRYYWAALKYKLGKIQSKNKS